MSEHSCFCVTLMSADSADHPRTQNSLAPSLIVAVHLFMRGPHRIHIGIMCRKGIFSPIWSILQRGAHILAPRQVPPLLFLLPPRPSLLSSTSDESNVDPELDTIASERRWQLQHGLEQCCRSSDASYPRRRHCDQCYRQHLEVSQTYATRRIHYLAWCVS